MTLLTHHTLRTTGMTSRVTSFLRRIVCEVADALIEAEAWVSKNLHERSQGDTDCWPGLFDTQASLAVGVSSMSN